LGIAVDRIADLRFRESRKKINALTPNYHPVSSSAPPLDDQQFEHLFKTYFKVLHAYSATMLRDEEAAEEIVQQLFLKLWEKREQLTFQTSVKAYLYKCVYHDSLNYLERQKTAERYREYASKTMNNEAEDSSRRLDLAQLESRLKEALNELPEQCRTVFQLSRFNDLKYKEIAEQMGLSPKTVENHMGRALKLLRLKLVDFLSLIILSLIYIAK
jgi:RNA polymerase sigma-70 factor, ECF subfamily